MQAIIQVGSKNDVFKPTSNKVLEAQRNLDPLRCEICEINYTSFEHHNSHMSGKKHLKKLNEVVQIVPDLSLTFTSSMDTQPMQNPESTEGKVVNSQEGNPVSCELCGISCNTYKVLKIHQARQQYQKILKKSGLPTGHNLAPWMQQDDTKEEGKVVHLDGTNKKIKRVVSDDDLEAKRQNIDKIHMTQVYTKRMTKSMTLSKD